MSAGRSEPAAQRRKRQLAEIHLAKAKLGLDDDTYRALIERVSAEHGLAVRSAADLSPSQRQAVVNELRRLGGRQFDVQKDRPANLRERPLLRKIGALLADGKKPWAYGHAIAKRMGYGDRLEFCRDDQLRAVVAALDRERRRSAARTSGGGA